MESLTRTREDLEAKWDAAAGSREVNETQLEQDSKRKWAKISV